MQLVVINIFRFFLLVIIQIFIVNNLNFGGADFLIAPFVYISYILTLPNTLNRYLLLVIAFFLGLTIDFFMDTYGVHASASVLVAFLRPRFTKQLESKNAFQDTYNLSIYMFDFFQYLIYITTLIAIFLFWILLLEEFKFSRIHFVLLKTILSTIVSVALIVMGQYLFFNKPKL